MRTVPESKASGKLAWRTSCEVRASRCLQCLAFVAPLASLQRWHAASSRLQRAAWATVPLLRPKVPRVQFDQLVHSRVCASQANLSGFLLLGQSAFQQISLCVLSVHIMMSDKRVKTTHTPNSERRLMYSQSLRKALLTTDLRAQLLRGVAPHSSHHTAPAQGPSTRLAKVASPPNFQTTGGAQPPDQRSTTESVRLLRLPKQLRTAKTNN